MTLKGKEYPFYLSTRCKLDALWSICSLFWLLLQLEFYQWFIAVNGISLRSIRAWEGISCLTVTQEHWCLHPWDRFWSKLRWCALQKGRLHERVLMSQSWQGLGWLLLGQGLARLARLWKNGLDFEFTLRCWKADHRPELWSGLVGLQELNQQLSVRKLSMKSVNSIFLCSFQRCLLYAFQFQAVPR